MNITDIKKQIQTGSLSHYYIFSGEEIEVQRIYINKMAEIKGCQIIHADKLADVWQDIISPSMFDDGVIYVVRDDKDILSGKVQLNEELLGENILIHLITSVDKRTKWYKSNSDKIVEFERLSSEVLKKYIQRAISLNKTNCERFIAICENDYSRILLEIDKIQRYITVTNSSADVAFEELVKSGAIYQPPSDAIFDLVDAILHRKVNLTYNLLQECYEIGEASLVILNVLYSNTKQVLQVQACESDDVSSSTGLTKWQVKCAKDKCNYYSNGELVNILRQIQKIQKGIITGQIDDNMSVEYLLVNIL